MGETGGRDRAACREVAAASFRINAAAVASLAERLDASFDRALDLVLGSDGKVVVSGVGKSGHIGRKISATLASLGTPSIFVHATEAIHGDLGMIVPGDVVILVSYSGETEEVVRLIPFLKRNRNPIVALTGRRDAKLARHADVVLDGGIEREACPLNLAPTTSTMVALALGDALAMALGQARGFRAADFARSHPGGKLGQRLMTQVTEVMRRHELPRCTPDATLKDVLPVMTAGRLGLVLVEEAGLLAGIVTDGDIRRALERHGDLDGLRAADVMSRSPIRIAPTATVFDADELMHERRVTALVVAEPDGPVLGVVQVHD